MLSGPAEGGPCVKLLNSLKVGLLRTLLPSEEGGQRRFQLCWNLNEFSNFTYGCVKNIILL